MKKRSVPVVIIASLLTFGIYGLVWYHMTREEMMAQGVPSMPSPWLVLIPFVGPFILIYFLWQYSAGVEKVTNGKFSQIMAFVLLFLVGFIGIGLVQNAYNEIPAGGSTKPFA
jgi:hypothetical protein